MNTEERPRRAMPLYARTLRLRHLRISGLTSFLLVEGTIAVAILLALSELVSWWAVPVLPALVAGVVKVNDMVAGPRRTLIPRRDSVRDECDESFSAPAQASPRHGERVPTRLGALVSAGGAGGDRPAGDPTRRLPGGVGTARARIAVDQPRQRGASGTRLGLVADRREAAAVNGYETRQRRVASETAPTDPDTISLDHGPAATATSRHPGWDGAGRRVGRDSADDTFALGTPDRDAPVAPSETQTPHRARVIGAAVRRSMAQAQSAARNSGGGHTFGSGRVARGGTAGRHSRVDGRAARHYGLNERGFGRAG